MVLNFTKLYIRKLHVRFMTMMELLIAMSLTMILLSVLTYFYREIELLSDAAEKLQKQNFLTRYAENRLTQVFAKTVPEFNFNHQNISDSFCFFTSGDAHGLLAPGMPSLIFMFDNGAHATGNPASVVLASLYVDKQARLCLAIWPQPREWQDIQKSNDTDLMQNEILLENVKSLAFNFYIAPQKERLPLLNSIKERIPIFQPVEPPQHTPPWIPEWRQDYHLLPPMIRILVTQQDPNTIEEPREIIFAFPLPYSKQLVMYGGP